MTTLELKSFPLKALKEGGKKYYIYAGYYELWISERKLTAPLTYIGWCRTLENAIERCHRIDDYACVHYSEALRDEVVGYFAWCGPEEIDNGCAFFDSAYYSMNLNN